MSEPVPAPAARRGLAVTLLGVITLLYGAFYGVIGVLLIVNGAQFVQAVFQAKEEVKGAINQAATNQITTNRDVPGVTNSGTTKRETGATGPGTTNPEGVPDGQKIDQA